MPPAPTPGPCSAPDPVAGAGTTYYVPYPILALASNGEDIFMTAGGGGSTSVKEVPNQIHAHRYSEATKKLSTIAAFNTGTNLVVHLSYSPVTKLWLASMRKGCKIFSLSVSDNTMTELCEFESEAEGKEPEQNFAFYSPDASLIVTGGTDGYVKIWNAGGVGSVPVLARTCGSKTKEILDAAFSEDSKFMAACDGTGNCRVWEVQKDVPEDGMLFTFESKELKGKALIKTVRFLNHRVRPTLLFGANGTQRRMNWGTVGMYDLLGTQLFSVIVDKGPLKSISISADEMHLVVGLMTGKKVICQLPSLKSIQKTKELHSLPAQAVCFSGQCTAVSVSGDRDVHLLKVNLAGGSGFGFLIQVLLVLLAVAYMVYRIGITGAMVGQGQAEL